MKVEELKKIANRFRFVCTMNGGMARFSKTEHKDNPYVERYARLLRGWGNHMCSNCRQENKCSLSPETPVLVSYSKKILEKRYEWDDAKSERLILEKIKVMTFEKYEKENPLCFIEGCTNYKQRKKMPV